MASLSDKNAIMQVIGDLMKAPFILTDSKYILTKKDFDTPLARNIFIAITKMIFENKMEKITGINTKYK